MRELRVVGQIKTPTRDKQGGVCDNEDTSGLKCTQPSKPVPRGWFNYTWDQNAFLVTKFVSCFVLGGEGLGLVVIIHLVG
jgi:hypothetical protein